jgi:hypothetical protein
MFRIPATYCFKTSFDDAAKVMKSYGRGDLLEGMAALDRVWAEHAAGSDRFDSDDDFYEFYEAEVNAFNVIFEKMSPLFA